MRDLCLAAILVLVAASAGALSCDRSSPSVNVDPEAWWQRTEFILLARITSGRVLRRSPLLGRSMMSRSQLETLMQSDWMRTVSYEFEPLEVFKGDPNQIAEIIDTTNQWGLEPVIGAVYLLFMSGQGSNAVVTISPCGPSQRYLPSDEQQTKLLEWLRTRAN